MHAPVTMHRHPGAMMHRMRVRPCVSRWLVCAWASVAVALSLALLSVRADLYTDPEYTWSVQQATEQLPSDIVWFNSTTSRVDDYPYERLELPTNFSFPYWGHRYARLSVSPNGALHLPAPVLRGTCCYPAWYPAVARCSFFMQSVPPCNFDTAYSDTVAVSLADQNGEQISNEQAAAGAGVFYGYSPSNGGFFVRWVSMPLYVLPDTVNPATLPTSTFSVELRPSGAIRMRYEQVQDPSPLPGYNSPSTSTPVERAWLVGLRPPLAMDGVALTRRGESEWNTTQGGVYPPRASVRSDSTVRFWPLGSIACNSPSIGDGVSMSHTHIYLSDALGAANSMELLCVFNEAADLGAHPSVPAVYNGTLGAFWCPMPLGEAAGAVMRVGLAEAREPEVLIPLTPIFFTYYDAADPVLLRYASLASEEYTGSAGEEGSDLRFCYECARLRPAQCAAPQVEALCHTPSFGSTQGSTPTVLLADGYDWKARRAQRGGAWKLWCVWTDPNAPLADAGARAADPHGLNPFLHQVLWVPARVYDNSSWIICDLPPASAELVYPLPEGTQFNLSLAENNFVFAGALGPVGAGWGAREEGALSPLGVPRGAEDALARTEGNAHLRLAYRMVDPSDPDLVEYEAKDRVEAYMLAPASSRNLTEGGAHTSLNLTRLCDDCASRVPRLLVASTLANASSLAGDGAGFCMDARALRAEVCVSPPFGDEAGAADGGVVAATTHLFFQRYPAHIRRSLFSLSCALQPYEIRDQLVHWNKTVSWDEAVAAGDDTTGATINGTVVVRQVNVTRTYIPVGEASLFVPLVFDRASNLYACAMPSLDSLGLEALKLSSSTNLSTDSVLLRVAENNRVLDGVFRAGAGVGVAEPEEEVVYRFLPSDDPELVSFVSARTNVPPLAPWSSCFSCDPSLAPTPASHPTRGLRFTSEGGEYCFTTSDPSSVARGSACVSPRVGGVDVGADEGVKYNRSVQVYTDALVYPLVARATLTQLYCVWQPPLEWVSVYNATSNTTTREPVPPPDPFYSPVYSFNASVGFVVCSPPPYGLFPDALNLTLALSEFGVIIPLPKVRYEFVEAEQEEWVLWQAGRAELAEAATQSDTGSVDAVFSPASFCTSCHATSVSLSPAVTPPFTPGSPRGVPGLCFLDCALHWNGRARWDDCGTCTGGRTGRVFNEEQDCTGWCNGPFRAENVTVGAPGEEEVEERCLCMDRDECFNVTAQPLVGVSPLPIVPGQPPSTPVNQASVGSRQYLMRSFPLPASASDPSLPSTSNDASATHTPDPDFDDASFVSLPRDTWVGSGSGSAPSTDPLSLELGFRFPFFEAIYERIYVSSSGAIHFAAPGSSLPSSCLSLPSGTDSRVKNSGLLAGLFDDPLFERGCANKPILMPYFTFLDPGAAETEAEAGGDQEDGGGGAALLSALATPMPTNSSARVSFLRGSASLSIKFENVPFHATAFAPGGGQGNDSNPAPSPPLYSFQTTLYASGRVSVKHFVVHDPAGTLDGEDDDVGGSEGEDGAFNTTSLFRHLLVGMVNRPMPRSVLTQSAPTEGYLKQLARDQGVPFAVQGSVSMERQQEWIPGSLVPIGVFPPRNEVTSGVQHVFCPMAINACAYPTMGPAEGGTVVRVSLWQLGLDEGCVQNLLRLRCVFGSEAVPSDASFEQETGTLRCVSPPGRALTTVPFNLAEGNGTIISSNKLFWSWLPRGDARLLRSDVDEFGRWTRSTPIAGSWDEDDDATNGNLTQSAAATAQHLCAHCSPFNPTYCTVDCNNDFFGEAFLDSCGECTGGLTGRQPNDARDCAGICGGKSQWVNVTLSEETEETVQQCSCAPSSDPLCQATALPLLNPPPTLARQYVYHAVSPIPSAPVDGALPPLSWTNFPEGAHTLGAPLPEFLPIELPFLFPFFSQSLRTVYLSGWGALFMESMPTASLARDSCLRGGVAAAFNASAANSVCPLQWIAVSVAEYDLQDHEARITYYTTSPSSDGEEGGPSLHSLTVVWSNMRAVSNASFSYTFAVQLAEDGRVSMSYLQVQDPNPVARAAVHDHPPPFVPRADALDPPAPAFASQAPFWAAGISQSWYTSPDIFLTPGSVDAAAAQLQQGILSQISAHSLSTGSADEGSTLSLDDASLPPVLEREIVAPFPVEDRMRAGASIAQRSFLPHNSATSMGTFPSRAALGSQGSDSQWQYCLLGLDLCASVTWGPVEGGTLLRFFGREWGCVSSSSSSIAALRPASSCCASQLSFSCVFGGLSVPAAFNLSTQSVECLTPPGAALNTSVAVHLAVGGAAEGGLGQGGRMASSAAFVFQYSVTRAQMELAQTDLLALPPSLWNLSTHNTDESACERCAEFMPAWMRSSASSISSSSSSSAAPPFCSVDCNGDFRGSAYLDSCGVCSGGLSGHVAESDRDCRGECFGPFRVLQASETDLIAAMGGSHAVGRCVCSNDIERAGVPSCAYYQPVDGPVHASEVMRLLPYEATLLSLAAATAVAGGVWWVSQRWKRRRQARGGGVGEGAQGPPPAIVIAPGGGGGAGAVAGAPFPAAAGAAGAAPANAAAVAAAAAPRSQRRARASGGAEVELQPPAPVAPRAHRSRRAEAAGPGMSAAAAAAIGGSRSSSAEAHRPPASHYTFSNAAGRAV